MTDWGFMSGCIIIAFGILLSSRREIRVSHDFVYGSLYQINNTIKQWHKEKHESANYYTPTKRYQDSSQGRSDHAAGSSGEDS